jgi:hypothetical protein
MEFIRINHLDNYARPLKCLNDQGGYYGETDGTSNPWSFPIAFKNKPFYVNGSADLSSKTAYDFDRPAWAMAINNTQFLCSINYDKTGTSGIRQVRVLSIGI